MHRQNKEQGSTSEQSAATANVAGAFCSTILAVDDERRVLHLITRLLTTHGFRVIAAETVRDALKLWRERNREVDLLLTDVIMPGEITGRALAEQLQHEKSGLKVLLTSGYEMALSAKQANSSPRTDFVQKPFSPDQLLAAVRRVLSLETIAPSC